MERGLLLVFTGNTKDSALSAVGQVLRALGAGLKICVIQFGPESQKYKALSLLQQHFNMIETYGINDDHATHVETRVLWQKALEMLNSAESGLLVLLEASCLLEDNVAGEREFLEAIQHRTGSIHVVVAGGRIPDSLLQEADLITEVTEIKNALRKIDSANPSASGVPDPA
jgi:cob(I)alamin adenosyltransferase